MVRCLVYCNYFRLFLIILFLIHITVMPYANTTSGSIFEGGKYKSYISEIIKIAEQKRKPLEDELEHTLLRKEVLEESKESVKFVQEALDSLFGLKSVFHTSIATSSNPTVVTATTKKGTKSANMELVVQQIAETDQFYSDSLALDYQIPAGQYEFEIGGQYINLNYLGGHLDEFAENLSKINPEHLKASVIKNAPGQQVFLLSGQKTSESMRLNFKGRAKEWALEVGILTESLPIKYTVVLDSFDLRSQSIGKAFDMKRGADLGPGRYLEIRPDSKIPLEIDQNSYFSFEYKKEISQSISEINLPRSSDYTKKEAAREGFIVSLRNNNTVDLPRIPNQPNIYLNSNGKLILVKPVSLQSNLTSMKIALSEYKVSSIESIVLYNGGDSANFQIKNLQLITPAKKGELFPKNIASRAQDSKFTLDGVTIIRPVNEINDVSSEFSFHLKSVDPNPVTISIKQDIDSAIRAINDFVTVYNYHISKLNIVTSVKNNTAIVQEISFSNDEERKKAEESLGLYQGDSQMIQMKRHLFFLMSNPYLVGIERSKKLLIKELGIHTGTKLGISGDSSQRRGYFEVDQTQLRAKLEMSWDEVRDFFASYTGGDSVITDDGLAVKMRNYLQSFLGRSGLVSERVRLLEKQIEKKKKTIADFDTKLAAQKKKMERDFMKVQSAETEMERFTKQMDSFFPNK